MKTAEEWHKILLGMMSTLAVMNEHDIRAIQLEAYRAGMEAAARMIESEGYTGSYSHACNVLSKIILDAAKTAQLP